MAYTITVNILSYSTGETLPPLYIRADATNPTSIEPNTSVNLKFIADGTFYTLPAKARVTVTGATKGEWVRTGGSTNGTLTISNATDNVVVTLKADARVSYLSFGPFVSPNQTPIDARIILNKSQMPLVNDADQPDRYFAVCRDDNKLYIYDKTATVDPTLGKFRALEDFIKFKVDGGEQV